MQAIEKSFKTPESALLPNAEGKQILLAFESIFSFKNTRAGDSDILWANYLRRELGLEMSLPVLLVIRKAAENHLEETLGTGTATLAYSLKMEEVYRRLNNNGLLNISAEGFLKTAEEAEAIAALRCFSKREDGIYALNSLKTEGYHIHLVVETGLPESAIYKVLASNGLDNIFDQLFISSVLGLKIQTGEMLEHICRELQLTTSEVLWIHAGEGSMPAMEIPTADFKLYQPPTRKRQTDRKRCLRALKASERRCLKSNAPFSEYILFFHYFTEKLYKAARKNQVENLFFLSREGMFLKTLFDLYQENIGLAAENRIKTHYLMVSRQSVMLTSFRELEQESFDFFRKKYGTMSAAKFLDAFLFSKEQMKYILADAGLEAEVVVENFVDSDSMNALRRSKEFQKAYEQVRLEQKNNFSEYLDSFGVDFIKEGMTVVDVGWGGSMQESLVAYFENAVPVTGYYIGIRYIYDIKAISKRYGLYFSVYPYATRMDAIKSANSQLFEQLLGAPHGSTLGYTSDQKNYAIQFHQEDEKFVHDNYVAAVQEFMLAEFRTLLASLDTVCYEEETIKHFIDGLALRVGIFASRKKLSFLENISKGFYLNIGQTRTGITYDPKNIKTPKKELIRQFLVTPEIPFRYILKLKSLLFRRHLHLLGFPVNLFYYYIRLNFYLRDRFYPKRPSNLEQAR